MNKVIIDTNVLISATLKGRTPAKAILHIVELPEDYEWLVSQEILTEYREVLNRKKFNLSDANKRHWNQIIDTFTTLIDVNIDIEFPRDRKDAKFLACAIASSADYLITGDKDFTEAQKLISTTIISVSAFAQLFCNK